MNPTDADMSSPHFSFTELEELLLQNACDAIKSDLETNLLPPTREAVDAAKLGLLQISHALRG